MNPSTGLLIALGIAAVYFLAVVTQGMLRHRGEWRPGGIAIGTGALTDFLDTLGIGSFAPTTALFRATRLIPDEQIPGTLNIGHAPPTVLQGFLLIGAVAVDPTTLIAMIAAATAGAWFGANVVAGWPRRAIQTGMGIALLCSAGLFVARNLGLIHIGGTADGVGGWLLVIAVLVNLALGAFMTIGIGLYAPCMILVSLLGMNERAAYPIMMGSCAFLQIAAARPFIQKDAWSLPASLGLAIGGLPAVWIAATWVTSVPLQELRWLIAAIVLYTGVTMLQAAFAARGPAPAPGAGA